MKINCTYKEMLDYVRNYGEIEGTFYNPTTAATRLRNTWAFVNMIPDLLKTAPDFHVVVRQEADVSGFKQLVFTFDEPINSPHRLAHYLKTFDNYMLKNYPKSYVSIFREYPDWWLLWCFLERAMKYDGDRKSVV